MKDFTKKVNDRMVMANDVLLTYNDNPTFVMEIINDAINGRDTSELTIEEAVFNMDDNEIENVFTRIQYLKSR